MHPILLYDGVCGLCNRFVQFILRRDRTAIFRFASLQSPFAAPILARHSANPDFRTIDFDTIYVVVNHDEANESLFSRSDAVVFSLSQLGGFWSLAALALRVVPRPIRDFAYRLVARTRYRIFGRYDSCPLPSAETRSRFLDV
jgi:predicted DCC family thiol-disulfide oxidoreductase YuxK